MRGTFRAKWASTCASCGRPIHVGDAITWSRRGRRSYSHRDCSPKTEDTKTEPQQHEDERAPFDPTEALSQLGETLRTFDGRLSELEEALTRPGDAPDADAIRALLDDAVSKVTRPTVIELRAPDGRTVAVEGVQHSLFPDLMYHLQRRENVYLYGPSQSGKSTAAHNVARALDLPFYYLSLNPQTPDSRIVGFIDAGGNYRETVFYAAYARGGVVCLDEVDNASSSLLTTLNSALANGVASFPCGMVEKHPDCIVVATGNTPGRGGTSQYPERRPLDGAFRERFSFMAWPYDEALEEALVLSANPGARPLLEWVRRVRSYTEEHGIPVLATPTSAVKLALYAKDETLSFGAALDAALFKGIEDSVRERIVDNVKIPGGAKW